MPIGGDPNGPIFEGWTLLVGPRRADRAAAPGAAGDQQPLPAAGDAGQDRRDRRHRLRRAARLRHRRGLAAQHPLARREYDANGLPYHDSAYAVGSLAEACTVIRRLWTEDEPFDFDGTYVQLTGAFGNPKPVQRPHPPIMIGGRSPATLRVVAEHADLWNIPGGDIDDAVARSALLDRYCAEIGRDPAAITRSIHLPVSYDQPGITRGASTRRSTPASRTSSSACRRPIPPASRGGSPTSSSPTMLGGDGPTSKR